MRARHLWRAARAALKTSRRWIWAFFKHLCARVLPFFYFKQVCRSIQMREPCRRLDAWPQHVPFASLWGCARSSSSPRGASRSHMWLATMRVVVVCECHRESRERIRCVRNKVGAQRAASSWLADTPFVIFKVPRVPHSRNFPTRWMSHLLLSPPVASTLAVYRSSLLMFYKILLEIYEKKISEETANLISCVVKLANYLILFLDNVLSLIINYLNIYFAYLFLSFRLSQPFHPFMGYGNYVLSNTKSFSLLKTIILYKDFCPENVATFSSVSVFLSVCQTFIKYGTALLH